MNHVILGIDPGTTRSGYAIYDRELHRVLESGVLSNPDVLVMLADAPYRLVIEMIANMGMPAGKETFETVRWIGRFQQRYHAPESVEFVYRTAVKLHLCGTCRAKDPNVRQALIDLFPPTGGGKTPQIGTTKEPGPLFGVASHAWPALAVCITAAGVHHGNLPEAVMEIAE